LTEKIFLNSLTIDIIYKQRNNKNTNRKVLSSKGEPGRKKRKTFV